MPVPTRGSGLVSWHEGEIAKYNDNPDLCTRSSPLDTSVMADNTNVGDASTSAAPNVNTTPSADNASTASRAADAQLESRRAIHRHAGNARSRIPIEEDYQMIIDHLLDFEPTAEGAVTLDSLDFMLMSLPGPATVLTTEQYDKPPSTLYMLRQLLRSHEIDHVGPDELREAGCDDSDLLDSRTHLMVWMAITLGCDKTFLTQAVRNIRLYRRRNITPLPPLASPVNAGTLPQPANSSAFTQGIPNQAAASGAPQISQVTHPAAQQSQHNVTAAPSGAYSSTTPLTDRAAAQTKPHRPTPKPEVDSRGTIDRSAYPPSLPAQYRQSNRAKLISGLSYAIREKFDGISDRISIGTILRDYELFTEQAEMSDEAEKALFVSNILEKEAKEFFLSFYHRNMTYKRVKEMLLQQYNSKAVQTAKLAEMDALDFQSFKDKHGLESDIKTLRQLIDYINTTSP